MIDFTKCLELVFNTKKVVELYYNGRKVWSSTTPPTQLAAVRLRSTNGKWEEYTYNDIKDYLVDE